MLAELRDDDAHLTHFLRVAHELCAGHNDVATTSLIEVWIDQTERRTWFSRGNCERTVNMPSMSRTLEQEAIEVCKDKLQHELTQAIVTAYLITGSTGQSEAAVMAAIEQWEPNKGVKSLLELVAGLAVKYEGGQRDEWPLRGELQNVVRLPLNARRSFVLRILLGVPREVCTKLLHLNTDEVDYQTCAALVALGGPEFREKRTPAKL